MGKRQESIQVKYRFLYHVITKKIAESALNQTQKAYHMKSELEKTRCECVVHERLNASDAIAYLVSICPTDWFVFLDADDILASNFIEVFDKR